MAIAEYLPGAVLKGGKLSYSDRSALERDLGPFLSLGIVPLSGDTLPPLNQEFDFLLELPNGQTFPLKGKIVAARKRRGVVSILGWTEDLAIAVQTGLVQPAQPEAKASTAAAADSANLYSGSNRRLFPRSDRQLKVRIGDSSGTTIDISPRGFGVEIEPAKGPGTVVEGSILVERKELKFSGEVRWSRGPNPKRGQRSSMGVRFINVDNDYYALFQPRPSGSAPPAQARGQRKGTAQTRTLEASALIVSAERGVGGAIQAASKALRLDWTLVGTASGAIGALRRHTFSWLFLDEDVPLSSLVLSTFNQLPTAPRLVTIRQQHRRNAPAQTGRLLLKPFVADDVLTLLSSVFDRPPRHAYPLDVEISAEGTAPQKLVARDLSLTGAFISCENPLPNGTKLNLAFVPGDNPIRITARVVRVVDEHQARRSNAYVGIGVEFADIPEGSLARLRDLVQELSEARGSERRPQTTLQDALKSRAVLMDRSAKAESYARAAHAEMEEKKFDRALANATLAASYAPMREEFQELRRQLLARVNFLRAQVAFKKGEYLQSEGRAEEAIKAFDEACELDPSPLHLKRAAMLRLASHRDLAKGRALAQLALSLNENDAKSKELIQQLTAAMKKSSPSTES